LTRLAPIVDAVRAFDPAAVPRHLLGHPVRHATGLAGRLRVDDVPVAAPADHTPINYVTLVWNALVAGPS
jgi:hypothetical protein